VRPEADTDDWDQKDVEAQSIIVSTLDQKQTNHIVQCESAKEIFQRLERIHSDHSALNKQHVLAEFLNFKMKPNQSLTDVYSEVEKLVRNLNRMGVAIDETTAITKIVSSLPDNPHKAFKKAWDSVPEESQTMDMLHSRLKKEDLEAKTKVGAIAQTSKDQAKAFTTQGPSNPHPHMDFHAFPTPGKTEGGQRDAGTGKAQKIAELKKRTNCAKCGIGQRNAPTRADGDRQQRKPMLPWLVLGKWREKSGQLRTWPGPSCSDLTHGFSFGQKPWPQQFTCSTES